jgi:hypothetical protein
MKPYAHTLCLLPLLLLLVMPGAAQTTGNAQTKVDEVLELFGVTDYSKQLPGIILSALDQQQAQMEPEVYRDLRNAFEFTFTSEKLYKRVAATFTEQGGDDQLSRTLVWLQTPLSRKITALESAANTLEAMEAIQQYGALLDSQPPPQSRLALIERLDKTTGATESALEIQGALVRALLEGGNSLLPEEKRPPSEQVDSLIASMRAQWREPLRQQLQVAMLYTYRDVSDEELAEYLAYWETEDGRWLTRTTNRALLDAMSAASREAGALISLQGVDVTPQE